MKNSIILTAVILGMFSLAGCGSAAEQEGIAAEVEDMAGIVTETDEQEETAAGEEDAEAISIRFDEAVNEYKADDGTLLLSVRTVFPVVEYTGNEAAAEAINEYVKKTDFLGVNAEEVSEWAKEDIEVRGKDNWNPYAMETVFESARTDSEVISFRISGYSDFGGAHPNSSAAGLNFNSKTGERLKLADVVKDDAAAREEIIAFILEETKKEKYADMLFPDYEESIGALLTEDTWLLAEDGFHVIGNEYIISPHVAGILDFMIPYSTAGFLKDEYKR